MEYVFDLHVAVLSLRKTLDVQRNPDRIIFGTVGSDSRFSEKVISC